MPFTPEQLDAYVEAMAALLALPVAAEWQAAVRANLETTLQAANVVSAFPLPDEAEFAPVFGSDR